MLCAHKPPSVPHIKIVSSSSHPHHTSGILFSHPSCHEITHIAPAVVCTSFLFTKLAAAIGDMRNGRSKGENNFFYSKNTKGVIRPIYFFRSFAYSWVLLLHDWRERERSSRRHRMEFERGRRVWNLFPVWGLIDRNEANLGTPAGGPERVHIIMRYNTGESNHTRQNAPSRARPRAPRVCGAETSLEAAFIGGWGWTVNGPPLGLSCQTTHKQKKKKKGCCYGKR
ncbi:hypothetical protein H4582DRAFT_99873 [Lactarius indigo]|nr:hypothetical protein H4582DRAFT_99873 [Lactarius indigo]